MIVIFGKPNYELHHLQYCKFQASRRTARSASLVGSGRVRSRLIGFGQLFGPQTHVKYGGSYVFATFSLKIAFRNQKWPKLLPQGPQAAQFRRQDAHRDPQTDLNISRNYIQTPKMKTNTSTGTESNPIWRQKLHSDVQDAPSCPHMDRKQPDKCLTRAQNWLLHRTHIWIQHLSDSAMFTGRWWLAAWRLQ